MRRITVVFGRERFPAHVRRTPSTAKKIELQAIRCMEKTTRFVSQSTQKSIYEARECASTSKQLALFFLFCFSRHCMCKRFFSPAIFFAILVCRFTLKYSFFYDALSCNGNRLSFVWHFGWPLPRWWSSIGLSGDFSTYNLKKNLTTLPPLHAFFYSIFVGQKSPTTFCACTFSPFPHIWLVCGVKQTKSKLVYLLVDLKWFGNACAENATQTKW